MEHLAVEIAENDIERQSARFRELEEGRCVLLDRIEKAELAKQSVKERIYHKVRKEYETQLQALEKELQPLAVALDKSRTSVENQIREIDIEIEELHDELDELAFRHRVGEFDETTAKESLTPLEQRHDRLVRSREDLSALLSRIGAKDAPPRTRVSQRNQDRPADRPPQDETPPGRTPPESIGASPRPDQPELGSTKRDPSLNEADPDRADTHVGESDKEVGWMGKDTGLNEADRDSTKTDPGSVEGDAVASLQGLEETDAFVDPTEWVGEFVQDETPAKTTNEVQPSHRTSSSPAENTRQDNPFPIPGERRERNAPDQLANLADPWDEFAESGDDFTSGNAGNPHDGGSPPGFPILIIARGSGAGKRLPLLPMTMTLGREVDNNIEVKDKDVARYHARISYESGKYVIQDLEGSSGTFVNGKQITKTALALGDVIRVGETELTLGVA